MSKVVKNQSQGHGYKYASLADFAKQGENVPPMRVEVVFNPVTGEMYEFEQYLDDKGEWQRGARIVSPGENARMNDAQAYGAALTYARRYTTAMATGAVTDDDDAVETGEWSPRNANHRETPANAPTVNWQNFAKAKTEPATAQQRAALHGIFGDKFDAVMAKVGGEDKLTKAQASELIGQGMAAKDAAKAA